MHHEELWLRRGSPRFGLARPGPSRPEGGMEELLGEDHAPPSHIMIDAYGAEGEWGLLQK